MSSARKKKSYRHTSTFYRKLKQQLGEGSGNRIHCLQHTIVKNSNFIIGKPSSKQVSLTPPAQIHGQIIGTEIIDNCTDVQTLPV